MIGGALPYHTFHTDLAQLHRQERSDVDQRDGDVRSSSDILAREERGHAGAVEHVDITEVEKDHTGRPPHDRGVHRTGDLFGTLVGHHTGHRDDHGVIGAQLSVYE